MVEAMEAVSWSIGEPVTLSPTHWQRDDGRHGGGVRWGTGDGLVFDRASVNVSQVHYDDEPQRRLASATALSTIIHPANPWAPSVHLHVSWTQMRDGDGYWRMMADLNPAIPRAADTAAFEACLRRAAPSQYDEAAAQGARYFWIPALDRHRGVAHFYLEAYASGSFADDASLAVRLGDGVIDTYAELVGAAAREHPHPEPEDRARQLAYHTLYLFQVLTLDRGTTSGLIVHDQNDAGILGSLPSHVDCALLASWTSRMHPLHAELTGTLLATLRRVAPVATADVRIVDEPAKLALAAAIREFYRLHPDALDLQASGDVIPPTVANHR